MAAQQRIKLSIISADRLHAADPTGTSDPYVKFRWHGDKYKTAVMSKTLQPMWNQSFILKYQPGKDPDVLRLEIWDRDHFSSNDPLGKVDLDFSKLQQLGSTTDTSYPLDKLNGVGRGELRVKVEFLDWGKQVMPNLQPTATRPHQAGSSQLIAPNSVALQYGQPYPGNPSQQYGYPNQQYAHPNQQYGYPNPQGAYPNQPPPGHPGYQQMGNYPQMPMQQSQYGMPMQQPQSGMQQSQYGMPMQQPQGGMQQSQYAMPTQQQGGMPMQQQGGMPMQQQTGMPMQQQTGMPIQQPQSDVPRVSAPSSQISPAGSQPSSQSTPESHKNEDPAEEIHRILPGETLPDIKAALAQFNGDKDKALNHLINHQIALAVQQATNQNAQAAAQASHPALGNCGPAVKPSAYTATYNPQGQFPQYVNAPQELKPAAQVIQDPATIYAGQGRKKALLIGINYFRTRAELKGCIQDVRRMKQVLVGIYGFPDIPEAIVTLTDDNPDPRYQPTRRNMTYAMRWLVQDARPGDIFFFHFSGHGAQKPNTDGTEEDGLDETILPCDYQSAGVMLDDEMHALLVQPLPSGSRLTAVMDCCHSGTGLDLPFIWDADSNCWEEETTPFLTQGDVQLFSGCGDGQVAADSSGSCGVYQHRESGGVMTTAFISAVTANPWGHSYPSLLQALRQNLIARGFRNQQPELSVSQKFPFNRPFNLTDIIPNHNQMLGRSWLNGKKNKKKKKKKNKYGKYGMGHGMMGGGMMGHGHGHGHGHTGLLIAGGLAGGFLLSQLLKR